MEVPFDSSNFSQFSWSLRSPLLILPVRAGLEHSRMVAPGVVLYTSFLLLLPFSTSTPSCYGHLVFVISQRPPHDCRDLGTIVASVWQEPQPYLTCKKIMLGFVFLSAGCREKQKPSPTLFVGTERKCLAAVFRSVQAYCQQWQILHRMSGIRMWISIK